MKTSVRNLTDWNCFQVGFGANKACCFFVHKLPPLTMAFHRGVAAGDKYADVEFIPSFFPPRLVVSLGDIASVSHT